MNCKQSTDEENSTSCWNGFWWGNSTSNIATKFVFCVRHQSFWLSARVITHTHGAIAKCIMHFNSLLALCPFPCSTRNFKPSFISRVRAVLKKTCQRAVIEIIRHSSRSHSASRNRLSLSVFLSLKAKSIHNKFEWCARSGSGVAGKHPHFCSALCSGVVLAYGAAWYKSRIIGGIAHCHFGLTIFKQYPGRREFWLQGTCIKYTF